VTVSTVSAGRLAASPGSIGKAMAMLNCVGGHGAPITLSAVARQTGLPKSTVHRLLALLEAYGAVRRVSHGYVLGETIRRLAGGEGARREALRRALMPHLAELYEAIHLSTSLAVLDELTVACLVTIYPRNLAGQVLRTAERAPAHRTALGRVLLAYSPVPSPRPAEYDGPTEGELATIRTEGIAMTYESGVHGLAVPVGDLSTGISAIGVAGPAGEFDPITAETLLRRTAFDATRTQRRHRPRPRAS
jgi:DNA-binding IclR family transcriptional regulator